MTGKFRLGTLEGLNLEEITEMWNRCWRGYYYEMSYLPFHMKVWLDLSKVYLQHSVAIFEGHKVIGFSLLSVDGTDGWIAGTSIDPSYRHKGLFAPLLRTQLDQARKIGLKRIYLEVLEQNYAYKVYESVGFGHIRKLNVYRAISDWKRYDQSVRFRPLDMVSLEQYFRYRRAFFCPSWQRKEEYLSRYGRTMPLLNSSRTAGALFTNEKNTLLLDVWSVAGDGATEVMADVFDRIVQSLTLLNQPDDSITFFLNQLGICPSAIQFEMCMKL